MEASFWELKVAHTCVYTYMEMITKARVCLGPLHYAVQGEDERPERLMG